MPEIELGLRMPYVSTGRHGAFSAITIPQEPEIRETTALNLDIEHGHYCLAHWRWWFRI